MYVNLVSKKIKQNLNENDTYLTHKVDNQQSQKKTIFFAFILAGSRQVNAEHAQMLTATQFWQVHAYTPTIIRYEGQSLSLCMTQRRLQMMIIHLQKLH